MPGNPPFLIDILYEARFQARLETELDFPSILKSKIIPTKICPCSALAQLYLAQVNQPSWK